MDYKKIIKSRAARSKILRILSFVPDEPMLRIQYWIKTGRWLNLKNPKRFTEKLQWYKLYYRDPLMIQCVDKYDVRQHVKDIGLEDILIPCYGVYERAEDIDWDALPNRFVMKDTLGGGGNSVIIVTDKESADMEKLKAAAQRWAGRKTTARGGGREWPYYSGKAARVIFEGYLDSDPAKGGLIDYKFLCFNGKIAILYVLADRDMGNSAGCGIFSPEFELLPVNELDERPLARTVEKPQCYEEMKRVAEVIASRFPEVRVDLYCEKGKIYFGETTFFDSSGYMLFEPDSFDFYMGEKFVLPEKKN